MTVLLSLLLAFACGGATCTGPVQGTIALREAQDVFNEASLLTDKRYAEPFATKSTDVVPPESSQEKYARVVQIVNEQVLDAVDRHDLKVNALALLAFSEWQLKHYDKANVAAETGKDLYERAGLQSNRRDYGMLLILRGLVKHSQAFDRYQELRATRFLTPEEAESISTRMAEALTDVDEINMKFRREEPVAIYANRQQLLIVDNILRVWADTRPPERTMQPRCTWTARGSTLWQEKFPNDYAIKSEVDQLHDEIKQVGASLRCP
jgi:hypothetical protein